MWRRKARRSRPNRKGSKFESLPLIRQGGLATGKIDGSLQPRSSLVAARAFHAPAYVNSDCGAKAMTFDRIQVNALDRPLEIPLSRCSTAISLETIQVGALGRTHDWTISRRVVAYVRVPVIVAGGLGADNVAAAIAAVRTAGSIPRRAPTGATAATASTVRAHRQMCRRGFPS